MSHLATIQSHLALAFDARDTGSGREAAHQVRNAGAALAVAQEEMEAKLAPTVVCDSCGHKTRDHHSRVDKMDMKELRSTFRNARQELGVDATAAPVECRDSEGRLFGYGLTIYETNPNG